MTSAREAFTIDCCDQERVLKVTRVWEAWSLFPESFCGQLEKIFLTGDAVPQAVPPSDVGVPAASQPLSEAPFSDTNSASGAMDTDEHTMPQPTWRAAGTAAGASSAPSTTNAMDVDGEPIDGEPLGQPDDHGMEQPNEELDGEPLTAEDLDGEPIGDIDGEPL